MDKFGGKSKKKLNSVEFVEFVFSESEQEMSQIDADRREDALALSVVKKASLCHRGCRFNSHKHVEIWFQFCFPCAGPSRGSCPILQVRGNDRVGCYTFSDWLLVFLLSHHHRLLCRGDQVSANHQGYF